MASLQCSVTQAQVKSILDRGRGEDERRREREAKPFFVGGRVRERHNKIALDGRIGGKHRPTGDAIPLVMVDADEGTQPEPIAADHVQALLPVVGNVRGFVVAHPLVHCPGPLNSYHGKNVSQLDRVERTLPSSPPGHQSCHAQYTY